MSLKTQGEHRSNSQRLPISTPLTTEVKKADSSNAPIQPYFTFVSHTPQQKKMPRRSSKPIINWFQRKLAGTVKGKRSDTIPLAAPTGRAVSRANSMRPNGRVVSSPVPGGSAPYTRYRDRLEVSSIHRRKTISLNGDDFQSYENDSINALDGLSTAQDSTWSPASMLEADDDASVRPLPPSTPPSPAPSRSSSSYLSDPRTFRSIAASTKPTTVLSVDFPGNGMAHIAQVPVTPSSHRVQHMRQPSLGNPTASFSVLLPQPSRSSPQSGNHQTIGLSPMLPVQAPLHTSHHPRNNPRPSSPPLDCASVLTLASSAFAMPTRLGPQGYGSTSSSAFSGGDSMSHFGGSMFLDAENSSLFVPGEDGNDERDASVRALRPRSSRRGSWGSEVSGWSAQILQTSGTPSQERSLFASTNEATAEDGRAGQETESPTDEGALTDTVPHSSTYRNPDDSQQDASIDTSWGAQSDLVNPDLSVRACYRSTSSDTVGQSTIDKDSSIAVSSVQATEVSASCCHSFVLSDG